MVVWGRAGARGLIGEGGVCGWGGWSVIGEGGIWIGDGGV